MFCIGESCRIAVFVGGTGNGGEAVSPDGETRLQSKCASPTKLDLDIKQNIVILSKAKDLCFSAAKIYNFSVIIMHGFFGQCPQNDYVGEAFHRLPIYGRSRVGVAPEYFYAKHKNACLSFGRSGRPYGID